MPRTLARAPEHDRNRSLGWLAVAWMEFFVVHGPGDVQGQLVRHGDEYTGFIVDSYALDAAGRRIYDSAFLSRPKGCDKSGLGARFGLFEALGPCRFDGFAVGGEVYEDPWGLGFRYVYAPGEPMGRPVQTPYIRIMATEEGQTGNVYDTIFFNLTDEDAPLAHAPGVDAHASRVLLPGGGEITPSTASAASKDGGKETFVCFDETHLYTTPDLRRMYATVTRNLRKRKKIAETWFLETTTMFAPGEDSVAEKTYELAEQLAKKNPDGTPKYKRLRHRLLYDHRWGECEDLSREEQLRAAILEAFGEAIEWNDVDAIVDEFYDTRKEADDSRRYFLNARTSTADSWVKAQIWAARADAAKVVADGERITLGFDGSVREDSTALVGCRVSDGHLFLIDCWEKPEGPAGKDWQVDRVEVDGVVRAAMARYKVVGMYCDPAHWQDYIDTWTTDFGARMRVKATKARPLEWWTNRPTAIVAALKRLHDAIMDGSMSHDGSSVLTTHVLNAKRKDSGRAGVEIRKEYPKSSRKIDAAMAATLAYECRGDAVAMGLAKERTRRRAQGF
ncbi:terminase TerL endonuclease subunit [Amycolatopsis sp. NPDC004368]